jgi:1-acyl-sn-glycerol-3-phosphate acyltransferase
MSRPEIDVANYDALYDYYENRQPSERFSRFAFAALAKVYRPEAVFESGTADEVAKHLEANGSLIVAANHVNIHDQFVVASLARREEPLDQLPGRTIIPAKVSLFSPKPLRVAVDAMGAVPTFRYKDIADKQTGVADEEHVRYKRAADMRMIRMMTRTLIQGRHVAIFPEGTRNADDPSRVQKIQRGIGVIAQNAAKKTAVAVLPVGIAYGESVFTPRAAVGKPLAVRGYKAAAELTRDIHDALQSAVDLARY